LPANPFATKEKGTPDRHHERRETVSFALFNFPPIFLEPPHIKFLLTNLPSPPRHPPPATQSNPRASPGTARPSPPAAGISSGLVPDRSAPVAGLAAAASETLTRARDTASQRSPAGASPDCWVDSRGDFGREIAPFPSPLSDWAAS